MSQSDDSKKKETVDYSATQVALNLKDLLKEQGVETPPPSTADSKQTSAKVPAKECNFCKAIKGEIAVLNVFESEDVLAFLNVRPLAKGHLIVLPKRHARSLNDLTKEQIGELFEVAGMLSKVLMHEDFGHAGVALYMSDFLELDPAMRHIYINVIPRRKGDGIALKTSHPIKVDPPEMSRIAENIQLYYDDLIQQRFEIEL